MRVFALLAWILSLVAAQPALAASSPHLQTLEQQLSALLASRSGDVGVAALREVQPGIERALQAAGVMRSR